MIFRKIFFYLGSFFLLMGCQNNPISYDYLMQHPEELQAYYLNCSIQQSADCQTITRAMDAFNLLQNQQVLQPIEFGQRIMHTQQQLVSMQHAYRNAKPEEDHNKLVLMKEAYEDQVTQLHIYYAVIARIMFD